MTADDRSFRGAHFDGADFTGATFRECHMSQVTLRGCVISDLRITGFAGAIDTVVVEGVDVTEFVRDELDRRHPERVQLRNLRSADDLRAMWTTVEQLWATTGEQFAEMSASSLHERVDGEWSLVETLRHLVFATDVWLGRMVLGRSMPFHPLGLPPTDFAPADAASIGLRIDADPAFDEVMAVRSERTALMRDVLETLTDEALDEMRTAEPAPGWGVETHSLRTCLRVVLREECEHHRYASRDLAAVASRS